MHLDDGGIGEDILSISYDAAGSMMDMLDGVVYTIINGAPRDALDSSFV